LFEVNVKNQSLQSLQWLHRLYRRHQSYRLLAFLCLLIGGGIISAHILFFTIEFFSLKYAGTNGLFVILFGFFVFFLIRFLYQWFQEGIKISSFYHLWEQSHPEVYNRASLLVYTEKHADEIEKLGYSKELIEAEDQWLNQFIEKKLQEQHTRFPYTAFTIILAAIFSTTIFVFLQQDYLQNRMNTISEWLWVIPPKVSNEAIIIDQQIEVERGQPIAIKAKWIQPTENKDVRIHLSSSQNGWQSRRTKVVGSDISYQIAAVNQKIDYYISAGNILSKKGSIVPINPPSVIAARFHVTPPDYTGLPEEIHTRFRSLSFPAASQIVIDATASTDIQSATVLFGDSIQEVKYDKSQLHSSFIIRDTADLSIQIQDQHGLVGPARTVRFTSIPDVTPSVEIVNPKGDVEVPDNMLLKIQLKVQDDYHVLQAISHVQINKDPERVFEDSLINVSNNKQVQTEKEFFIVFDLDLANMKMFPGDEAEFYAEVWDNDVLHGPKSSRSTVMKILYPTLVDLLQELNKIEETQLSNLTDLVKEQKDITEETKKTIEKISEKLENRPLEGGEKESTWVEEKELQSLKERQEKLIEEAKKIEESLDEYKEKAEETFQNQEKKEEQQGFTPETLEKIERIQELYKEIVDKDSQELLNQLEETIEQLSEQITEEQLQDLQFSVQEFEQQLDRTLSMLESTVEQRQLEGLKQMAEELAQRQDHLERETNQLQDDKEQLENQSEGMSEEDRQAKENELNSKEDQLAQRQEKIQEDTQSFQEKMDEMIEEFKEKRPDIAKALEEMKKQMEQNQLTQEMKMAQQQLENNNTQQAQQHQQNAQQQLQQLTQQFQSPMFNMNMPMQQDTKVLTQLIQQGLYLSHQVEGLTESRLGQSEHMKALRFAQVFDRELRRIMGKWNEIASTNPFMNRKAGTFLQSSQKKLGDAIEAGQGSKWVGLHETRSSLTSLNSAIYQMMSDKQAMQQQMSQSQSQGMQQQMQQMISKQQSIQQMLQQLKKMGKEGQELRNELMKMAQEQAQVRKEIEKMMQQNRHAREMRNRLDGIYREMREVEALLEDGINDERMDEKQKRIMTRMLEAGTMQEKDEFGKEREEEIPEITKESETNQEPFKTDMPERFRQVIDGPSEENIPYMYREALKNLYIQLSDQVTQ
jgi:hypothetical protein